MRTLFVILLIAGALYGARQLFNHYEDIERKQLKGDQTAPVVEAVSTVLPGFPSGSGANLENSLAEAKRSGAPGLKAWLNQYRAYIRDPRLADIELDYVVLLGAANRVEARRVLASLRSRLQADSPVYSRFEKVEKAYQ